MVMSPSVHCGIRNLPSTSRHEKLWMVTDDALVIVALEQQHHGWHRTCGISSASEQAIAPRLRCYLLWQHNGMVRNGMRQQSCQPTWSAWLLVFWEHPVQEQSIDEAD